jgi:prepilin-type N-terminal cleavage/methylation domain-containing protein
MSRPANRSAARAARAFTLIELLIVVAIIAILAAIAVPNFLEAQVRAKVSRSRADMRSLATAIESYHLDHGAYSGCVDINSWITTNLNPGSTVTPRINGLVAFTTPISYISSALRDVFNTMEPTVSPTTSPDDQRVLVYWAPDFLIDYRGTDLRNRSSELFQEFPDVAVLGGRLRDQLWCTISFGPDQDLDIDDPPSETSGMVGGGITSSLAIIQPYDPTNGTLSDGDILRFRE